MENKLPQDIIKVIPRLAPGLDFLARRRMLLPALLLLSVHRPLAFVVGQSLWLCAPLGMLMPGARLEEWATLLSHPQSGMIIESLLADASTDERSAHREQSHQ